MADHYAMRDSSCERRSPDPEWHQRPQGDDEHPEWGVRAKDLCAPCGEPSGEEPDDTVVARWGRGPAFQVGLRATTYQCWHPSPHEQPLDPWRRAPGRARLRRTRATVGR